MNGGLPERSQGARARRGGREGTEKKRGAAGRPQRHRAGGQWRERFGLSCEAGRCSPLCTLRSPLSKQWSRLLLNRAGRGFPLSMPPLLRLSQTGAPPLPQKKHPRPRRLLFPQEPSLHSAVAEASKRVTILCPSWQKRCKLVRSTSACHHLTGWSRHVYKPTGAQGACSVSYSGSRRQILHEFLILKGN